MTSDFGVMYVATGQRYINECTRSARSVKKVMPDIPITIWAESSSDLDRECFDNINILKNPTKNLILDRVNLLQESSYIKTLYLDTDTYLLGSVYEISRLLERFELACTHAPVRIPNWEDPVRYAEIPICFPQLNAGVIAYRKSEPVMHFLQSWASIYQEQLEGEDPPKHDQSVFRQELYTSDLRSTILPPEYNFRTHHPFFKGRGLPVKILHGRDPSLSKAIRKINQSEGMRIYYFGNRNLPKRFLTRVLNFGR